MEDIKFTYEETRFGKYGGLFMPESLIAPMKQLSDAFNELKEDKSFYEAFKDLLENYVGRKTPLTLAPNLQNAAQGPKLFLKREDLLHTGAHKINNAIGQCLLAKYINKNRIIAETGAGQHGLATATACAKLGLECHIYMGEVDIKRQMPNVQKMRLLGAKVISVKSGTQTLKDSVNEALRDYAANFETTHYILGSALGPYPYPQIVEYFQKIIGEETYEQCQKQCGKNPNTIIACVGGGSNAIGMFAAFLDENDVQLIGVEAGGKGTNLGEHAARFSGGKPGVLHGAYSYVLQADMGQISNTHSISAGLDYPSVGPHHAYLHDQGRVKYTNVTDQEALTAFKLLTQTEGIIPALESAHAVAYYIKYAKQMKEDDIVVINLSGRGDKDLPQLLERALI